MTKEVASDEGKHIDEKAAEQLKKNGYVDDGLGGGKKHEVMRMRGNCVKTEEGLVFDGTVSQILATVGFKPKVINVTGEDDPDILAKLGPILGHDWSPGDDMITFKMTLNLHKKCGAAKTGPDLTEDDIPMILLYDFNKRICLALASQLYDPQGLITAFTQIQISLERRLAENRVLSE